MKEARGAVGLTLESAGASLSPPVNAPYLSDVERGKRPCPAERLDALASLYKMTREQKTALFVTAKCLPPKVHARILNNPATWGQDFKRMGPPTKVIPW